MNARPARRRRHRVLPGALALLVVGGAAAAWVLHEQRGFGSDTGARSASPVAGLPASTAAAPAVVTRHRASYPRSHAAVPILMYHVIAKAPPGALFPGLYVRPRELAGQVAALKRAGFHSVTMDQIRAAWLGRARLPRHSIVLSFDNGYRSQFTEALPILRRAGFVGVENIQLKGLPPANGGLTAAEIRALVANGWELDTQGESHADLVVQDAASLRFQIAVARATIRRRYHVPVNWFCYPSGHYDATVIAAVRRAGYVGSTTVIPGWAHRQDDPYRLPRLRVLGGTAPAALLGQIAAARAPVVIPPTYPPGI